MGVISRWNPVRAVPRGWRRFRRRSPLMQLRTAGALAVMVGGTALWVGLAPSSSATSAGSSRPNGGSGATLAQASTSTRGIVGKKINVVFPVVALNSLAGQEGFAQDLEYGQQAQAIHVFVNEINHNGGIHGRTINPIIVTFDPTNQAAMRALCKDWTQGSPAAFAVIDGLGTWEGANQLCITQEGHTPMIGQWSSVTSWSKQGAPYLWWTGVDQSVMLQAVVNWGLSSGLLAGKKVGIVVGDDASDQAALTQALLPDLQRAGITNVVRATIAADPTATSQTTTQAPLVIQRMKAAGVQSIIPIIPFNVFFPLLQAQTQQSYFPKLLLSDYGSSIQSALGLIPVPYETALDGQEGVTTLTLGGVDDNRPQAQGGYDPGVRSCYESWIKVYPKPAKGQPNNFIEEQGPIAAWCQAIRLFAAAANNAGQNLNRRSFVEGMAKVVNFQGTWSPTLTYGPKKFFGPTQYRVVELHNNVPPTSACATLATGKPQGTCWVVKQNWQPLPTP
jgi:ABC-type branched-subunit amino acid transport system substrate-binding protein